MLYDPPLPEFSVVQVKVPAGASETHPKVHGPSVAIIMNGGGSVGWENEKIAVGLGDTFFVSAETEVTFKNWAEEELMVYRAFCEAT